MSETTAEPNKPTLSGHLEVLSARLGKVPTVVDMHKKGDYHPETYLEHFGTWEQALEAAELNPEDMGAKKIPDRDLLDDLQRVADDLGRSPTKAELREHGRYSDKTYQNRFGTWNNALEAAGLETHERSDSELLEELRRLTVELGSPPKVKHMKERGEYGVVTYYRRFGSWDDALDEAGVSADGTVST